MNKIISQDKLNLDALFFKMKKSWVWIALSISIALAIAFLYLKYTNPVYNVSASLVVESESSGSRQASELLMDMKGPSFKGINIEDEIGKLQSYSMIEQAINNLDFHVSYYKTPGSLINTLGDVQTVELYHQSPFHVVIDFNAYQLINTPVVVEVLTKDKAKISIMQKEARLYDFSRDEQVGVIENLKYEKIIDVRKPYQDKYFSFMLNIDEESIPEMAEGKYYFTINRTPDLVKSYQGKLLVEPLNRDARILTLLVEGETPEKEMNFLNTLMDVYIEQDLENKNVTGVRTIDYIDDQLSTITDSLNKAELALESFRTSNRIMDIGFASSTVFEKLDRLEQEKAQSEIQLRYYNNIMKYLKSDRDFSEIVSPSAVGVSDPVLNSLIIELNRLYQQKAGMSISAHSDNPQIRSLDQQIESARGSLIENLNNLVKSTQSTLAYINQQVNQIERNIATLPASERKMIDLQRKFDFNDQTYSFFLQKKAEASIALATNTSDRKIIDKAMIGGKVAPNTNFVFLIAFLAGLLIPVGAIVARDSFNNKIMNKDDLRDSSDIPILGVVTHTSNKNVFDLYTNRKSALADSFNAIRLNLKYFSPDKNSKVIGITSSISGEGKTFFAINLALEYAVAGNRTLVIGSDLRKPKIQEYLRGVVNLKKGVGLSTFLANQASLEEIVNKTPIKNLDVIPAGPIPPNPLDLLASDRMKILLNEVKPYYDSIVLDTPPVGYVSEYLLLKDLTDINIFIVRYNYTTRQSLTEINELFEKRKIKNICFVFNDVNFSESYEYGYRAKAGEYYSRKSKKNFTINMNLPRKKDLTVK